MIHDIAPVDPVTDPSLADPVVDAGDPTPTGNVIELGDIAQDHLSPGTVITGLNTAASFNEMERAIAAKLAPLAQLRNNDALTRKPLANELRPKGFNGELRNGTAEVLPMDQAAYDALIKRQRIQFPPMSPIRLLMIADMHSSGRGVKGQIVREATYYRMGDLRGAGRVVRALGDPKSLVEAEPVVAALNLEAIARARAVSAYALQHTFSAGLPEMGKKR